MGYKSILIASICIGLVAFLCLIAFNQIIKPIGIFSKLGDKWPHRLQASSSLMMVLTAVCMLVIASIASIANIKIAKANREFVEQNNKLIALNNLQTEQLIKQVNIMTKKFDIDYAPILDIEPEIFKSQDSYFKFTKIDETHASLELQFKIINHGNVVANNKSALFKKMIIGLKINGKEEKIALTLTERPLASGSFIKPGTVIFPHKHMFVSYYYYFEGNIDKITKNIDYVYIELEVKYSGVVFNKEKEFITKATYKITDKEEQILSMSLPEHTR